MTLQLDVVSKTCQAITRQIRENFKSLTTHFVIHHDGQRNEALGVTAQEIIHHPAAETAMRLMQQARLNEDSSLLGTAVARRNIFLGLAWRDDLLALCTLNIDRLDNMKEVIRQSWHLGWHTIDAHAYHQNPGTRGEMERGIIVRRRGAMQMARANLQADVFSVIMCAFQGDIDAIKRTAQMRALNALTPRSTHMPEFYPYVIAMDATQFSFGTYGGKSPSRKSMIPAALKIAREVDKSLNDDAVMNWFSFCEPAQDMAWRGFSKEDILSTSINTSPDTHTRTTGHLVQDITKIKPSSFIDIREIYSPYADDDVNEKLHQKLIEQIFEDVIAKGISQHSPDPFIRLANKQNEELSEGRILGWCAPALQAAGKIFEKCEEGSHRTEHLVRTEWLSHKDDVKWDTLTEIGNKVVQHQRDGEIVTLSRLTEIAGEDRAARAIKNSVEATIKDPEYQNRLEHLNAPTVATPAPRGPSAKAAPRMAAAPAYSGPAAPGLGSSGAAKRPATQQPARDTSEATDERDRA